MKSNIPSISVVILCHNHEKFIAECLLSVLNQDYEGDFDIVIGDDASTDRTCEIVEQLLSSHPRGKQATLIKHQKNLNVSGNCYHTTAHAKGRFIIRCDGDDVQRHDRVREMARLIQLYPEAQVFSSQHSHIDGDGNIVEHQESGDCSVKRYTPCEPFGNVDIIWGCVSMWDRAVIEELGEFTAGKPDDMVLSYRAYLMGCTIVFTPKALVYYRQHGENMCHIADEQQRDIVFSYLLPTSFAHMMLDACTLYHRKGEQIDYKEKNYNIYQLYHALRKVTLRPHAEFGNNLITKWRYVVSRITNKPRDITKSLVFLLPSFVIRYLKGKRKK